jgi:DNA-binding Lrp family transcriptional regulator
VLLAIATILVATGIEPFNLVLIGQAAESGPLVVFIVSLLCGGLAIFLSSQTSRGLAGSAAFLYARSSYVCIVGVESFRTLVYQIETLIDSTWNCLTSTSKESEWIGCIILLFTQRDRGVSRSSRHPNDALAIVLINAEVGSEDELLRELRKLNSVSEAHAVYGVYDIVAKVEAETMKELKEVITSKARKLNNLRSSLTMMVTEGT